MKDMPNHVSYKKKYLHLIRASAGSGKTHRLTGEYIHLLFTEPNSYRHILAVTFTNKATEEMKSRIVKELHQLASGGSSPYLLELMGDFSSDEKQIRSEAKNILETILHDYSAFSISTIDSFFQQTMRAFTREMGLASGYNIELDETLLLMETVDLMLSELDNPENKMLLEWLLRFVQDKIQAGYTWKIEADVLKLGKELFRETYKSFSVEEQAAIQDKVQLEEYKKMLVRIIKGFEANAKAIGIRAVGIMERYDLAYDDFKHKSRSGFSILLKLADGEIAKPSARFISLADNIDLWNSDSSKIEAIHAAYADGLNDSVKEVVNLFENSSDYMTAKELLQNFYTLGILNDIKKRLQRLQQENNTLFLSDTTELLNEIISGADSPFIYEKTGTRISNYMIDEFQDTSRMQWENFRPLVEESLATGNFNLIVGDVKQSIYRFRNSDWSLLEKQLEKDFRQEYINNHLLDTNWRSERHIVEFNNAFFEKAALILQNHFDSSINNSDNLLLSGDKYGASYEKRSDSEDDSGSSVADEQNWDYRIEDVYKDLYQYLPAKKRDSGGEVKISFLKKDKDNNPRDMVLKELPLEIEALQDQGFALKDIAIVVRWNSEAVMVAKSLLDYKEQHPQSPYRYDIISNEALQIGGARSVKAVIALMRYFRTPGNNRLRMMAIYEYYKFRYNCSSNEALKAFREAAGDFPNEIKLQLNSIASKPFYDMIESLFAISNSELAEKESAYMEAFMDIVLQFGIDNSTNINAFLDWWDEEGNNKNLYSPEGQDAIRLITIHKSKGLGFGAVIMPFVNWPIDAMSRGGSPKIIWCKPKVPPFNSLNVAPVRYGKSLGDTIFRDDYINEKRFNYIDNLNLLYVAFTRAKERLIIFAPMSSGKNIVNVADLLWNSISDLSLPRTTENVILGDFLTESDDRWFFQIGKPTIKMSSAEDWEIDTYRIGKWHSSPYDERLKLRLNSIGFFSDDGSRDYGKLMHDIVSDVKSLSDIPEAVDRKVLDGELKEQEREPLTERLYKYLSIPEVSDWYSGKYTVLNETELLQRGGRFFRPDRIMIDNDRIIVADYKFGEVEKNSYIAQVKRYVEIVKGMGYRSVEGALFYVKSGKVLYI